MAKETFTVEELVMQLIGPVNPTGDHGVDTRRLVSMKELTGLIDSLLGRVAAASAAAYREEASMKAIGQHAENFLRYVRES